MAAAQPPRGLVVRAKLRAEGLMVRSGGRLLLQIGRLSVWERRILAVIGPSSAGKTTLLRGLCGIARDEPGLQCTGQLTLDGVPQDAVWPPEWARRVALVPQQPMLIRGSAAANVALAARRVLGLRGRPLAEAVNGALTESGLSHRQGDTRPAGELPPAEQRLVALARALALQPEVLLLDEPCAGLDDSATAAFEELLSRLRRRFTVVLVTHNLHVAARVSDFTVVLSGGHLAEAGPTAQVFAAPAHPGGLAFLSGLPGGAHAS